MSHTKTCGYLWPARGLPLASIPHAPVNGPPFLHRFVTKCPLFPNFTPNDPQILLFWSKFSGEIIKFWKKIANRSKTSKRCVKIAKFLVCNFTPNDPLFLICHPMTPFFTRKLSLMAHWWCISRCTPVTFVFEFPPPPFHLPVSQIVYDCKGLIIQRIT